MQENWVWSLCWEDPLENGTAPHSSLLAWRIPWTGDCGRLQSTGSQRVGHGWATFTFALQADSLPSAPPGKSYIISYVYLVAQMAKNLPAMQETQVRSLGQEDPLEKEMATHSSILAWRIPWTEEAGGLQSMGSQRVRHDWATNTDRYFNRWFINISSFFSSQFQLLLPSWGVWASYSPTLVFALQTAVPKIPFLRFTVWWTEQGFSLTCLPPSLPHSLPPSLFSSLLVFPTTPSPAVQPLLKRPQVLLRTRGHILCWAHTHWGPLPRPQLLPS